MREELYRTETGRRVFIGGWTNCLEHADINPNEILEAAVMTPSPQIRNKITRLALVSVIFWTIWLGIALPVRLAIRVGEGVKAAWRDILDDWNYVKGN